MASPKRSKKTPVQAKPVQAKPVIDEGVPDFLSDDAGDEVGDDVGEVSPGDEVFETPNHISEVAHGRELPKANAPTVMHGTLMRMSATGGVLQVGSETYGPGDTFRVVGGKGIPGLTPATSDEHEASRLEKAGIAERV